MNKKSLILMKIDGLGDYLIIRNIIREIKNYKKLKKYKIIFITNKKNKDLIRLLDNDLFDKLIYLDTYKFFYYKVYRYFIFFRLLFIKGDILINCMYSRHYDFDILAEKINSKKKIAYWGDLSRCTELQRLNSAMFYDKIIKLTEQKSDKFEFYINKVLFERIFNVKIAVNTTKIDNSDILFDKPKFTNKYICVFVGGSHKNKKLSLESISFIINDILKNTIYEIILCGDKNDMEYSKEIIRKIESSNKRRVLNLTGKSPLKALFNFINSAELVLSSESIAAHIAVALGKKVIVFSNGQHYGRFSPYPLKMSKNYHAIYPPYITESVKTPEGIKKIGIEFSLGNSMDINLIDPITILNEFYKLYTVVNAG